MTKITDTEMLAEKAKTIRKHIIQMLCEAGSGHSGGSLGAVEIAVALYYNLMNHKPDYPEWEDRDRFILSKGHCAPLLYAVLADCGYFPVEELMTLRKINSRLQGHPSMLKTPGVEAPTGSLGQGLSIACGLALGAKLAKKEYRVYVLLSDGELQEGQSWEAALFANKYRLDNLVAFVDRNYLQVDGPTEEVMPLDPLEKKWASFGWWVKQVQGHDFNDLLTSVEEAKTCHHPAVLICRTTKGKGVSFMENQVGWHGKAPSPEETKLALKEIEGGT